MYESLGEWIAYLCRSSMEEIKDQYQSIADISEGLFKDKGSKFIAIAFPVNTEDQAQELISETRKKYHDARHHCYAYRIGIDGEPYRINDDGEPSSSAGRPIHGQLLSFDVSDILVIVVRYFGGVKLGVSGLINAYRQASAEALNQARIIVKRVESRFELSYGYPKMNDVMRFLREEGMEIESTDFQVDCKLVAHAPRSREKQIIEKLEAFYAVEYTLLDEQIFVQDQ